MYCDIGFMNSEGTTCQLKCDDGEYPSVEWLNTVDVDYEMNENQIKSTTCLTCPSECLTCLGIESANDCITCLDSQYLSITDSIRQSG